MSKNSAVNELQDWATSLSQKESRLAKLEQELNENKTFKKFMELQKSVKNEMEAFKAAAIEELRRNDLKTVKIDWGTITLVEPKDRVVIEDESKVPGEYMVLAPDLKAIKDEYELTNVLVPGAGTKPVAPYVKLTPKKED